jgi:hypothetical protein
LKTNIVSFKNRLKTRVALIELLDLSGIAVGNVGVPTCLNGKVCLSATSEAGARWPRRGGVFPRRHAFVD